MAYNAGTIPTLAEEITGDFIAPVYSKNVLMHVMSNLVVANAVNTDYRADLKYGNMVYIPVLSEVTTAEVTPGTESTAINAVDTPVSITVNKWRVAAIEESEMMNIEDHVGYLEKAAQSCGYAIAKDIDTTLGAEFDTLGGYSTSGYGSDGQTLTDDIILALMEYLDEGDVPQDDRSLICDPSSKADLLAIDKFIRNDYVRQPVVATGQFGMIYNTKVLITNNLTTATTGHYGCMLHRDALGLVVQKDPYSQKIPMPWVHKTKYQTKVIYGVGELRDTFGIPFFTRKA
jgi:hypothetical protein